MLGWSRLTWSSPGASAGASSRLLPLRELGVRGCVLSCLGGLWGPLRPRPYAGRAVAPTAPLLQLQFPPQLASPLPPWLSPPQAGSPSSRPGLRTCTAWRRSAGAPATPSPSPSPATPTTALLTPPSRSRARPGAWGSRRLQLRQSHRTRCLTPGSDLPMTCLHL